MKNKKLIIGISAAAAVLVVGGGIWFALGRDGSGNDENVVNWYNNGYELKAFSGSVIRNEEFYFRRCISWNDISTYKTGFRYIDGNSISNASGPSVYGDGDILFYVFNIFHNKITLLFN